MKHKLFRKAIQWCGVLLIAHAIAALIYGIVFSSSVGYMMEDQPMRAKMTVFVFNIVFDAAILAYISHMDTSYVDYRKTMKDDLKAGTFSVQKYFYTREHVIKIATFSALQLPFAIFYAIWGMSLQYSTLFEQFYIMDAGCYLLTESFLLGLLLNTLMFGAIYTLIKLLFILITKKRLKEDLSL